MKTAKELIESMVAEQEIAFDKNQPAISHMNNILKSANELDHYILKLIGYIQDEKEKDAVMDVRNTFNKFIYTVITAQRIIRGYEKEESPAEQPAVTTEKKKR